MSTFELLAPEAVLDVPETVRLCPYCGGKLQVRFEAWSQEDDGTWKADGSSIECMNEPDMDEDHWDDWWSNHMFMPYVYWLPAENAVTEWINKRYRFSMD